MATSESQTKLCVLLDTGHVWLGTLGRTIIRHQMDVVASSVVWCGEHAVMLVSDTGSALMLHVSGTIILFSIDYESTENTVYNKKVLID